MALTLYGISTEETVEGGGGLLGGGEGRSREGERLSGNCLSLDVPL